MVFVPWLATAASDALEIGELSKLRGSLRVDVVNRDVGAKLRETQRNGMPKAASGSGDERDFPLQRELFIHLSPFYIHPSARRFSTLFCNCCIS